MRFWFAALIALVAPLSASFARNEAIELVPRCGGAFQLCGYSAKGSDSLIIAQQFEIAQPFSSGLAAVWQQFGWRASGGTLIRPETP